MPMISLDPLISTDSPLATVRQGDIPGAARALLARLSQPRRWRNGQTIVHQGDRAQSAFIVRTGRVRMRTIGSDGNEHVVGWLGRGAVGALASVLAGLPFPCDIVADGVCDLGHVDGNRLSQALADDPRACLALGRVMAARLVHVTAWYAQRCSAPLAERVALAIRRLTAANQRAGEREPAVIRMSQADFARNVGASRYRVALVLRDMRDAGRVALVRGAIVNLA